MSQIKVNTINDASGGSNAVLYGVAAPANSMGFRNRLINGDMRIDQRSAGASVTITNTGNFTYTLDRWAAYGTIGSKFSVEQTVSGVSAPTGFSDYLGVTSLAATSLGAADNYAVRQFIEGFNFADMAWGTASAATVTLSFWVRSSLAGTFGGSLMNAAYNRSYPFTYTVSSANTWEQKSVTIAGDTSGTWVVGTNGIGVQVVFGLGVGATYSGTSGAWASSQYLSATGATSVVGTSGATFYITGVQLEAGSVASPFERRDYGRELMMCQRYYQINQETSGNGAAASSPNTLVTWPFPVVMRAVPTVTTTVMIGSSPTAYPRYDGVVWQMTSSALNMYNLSNSKASAEL